MGLSDILLVIDMQNDVLKACGGVSRLLKQINKRISDYRQAAKPILFIQHNDEELTKGSRAWRLSPVLDARPEDIYVEKTHANGFYHTNLQEELQKLGVTSIEFSGAMTPYCVNTTLVFAHGLDYHCSMQHGASSTAPKDHASRIVNYYENTIWEHRFLEFVD
ncbi:MAG: isochorismatase family protein [Streptococcaceae bacterium]|jgi:nicotinamidase-related amidase|nr:isochorismatase family protein [Streptococcaceae bacterium]